MFADWRGEDIKAVELQPSPDPGYMLIFYFTSLLLIFFARPAAAVPVPVEEQGTKEIMIAKISVIFNKVLIV